MERLTVEDYVGACFIKCGQVVLSSRINEKASPSGDRRASKSFLLELDEVQGAKPLLEPWRKDISGPMVVEVLLLPWGAQATPGMQGGCSEMLLERWTLQHGLAAVVSAPPPPGQATSGVYSRSGGGGSTSGGSSGRTYVDEASVYKRLTLLVRSLFSYVRVLPAYRMYRACKRHGAQQGFSIAYRVGKTASGSTGATAGAVPVPGARQDAWAGGAAGQHQHQHQRGSRLQQFAFTPVDTPGGCCFRVAVEYAPVPVVQSLEQAMAPAPSLPRNIIQDYIAPQHQHQHHAGSSQQPMVPPSSSAPTYGMRYINAANRQQQQQQQSQQHTQGSQVQRQQGGQAQPQPQPQPQQGADVASPRHLRAASDVTALAGTAQQSPPLGDALGALSGAPAPSSSRTSTSGTTRPMVVPRSWSSKPVKVAWDLKAAGVGAGSAGQQQLADADLAALSSSVPSSSAAAMAAAMQQLVVVGSVPVGGIAAAAAAAAAGRGPGVAGTAAAASTSPRVSGRPPLHPGTSPRITAFAGAGAAPAVAAAAQAAAGAVPVPGAPGAAPAAGAGAAFPGVMQMQFSAPVGIPIKPRTRSVVDMVANTVYDFPEFPAASAVGAKAAGSATGAAAGGAPGNSLGAGGNATPGAGQMGDGAGSSGDSGAGAAVAAARRLAPSSAPAAPRGMLGLALGQQQQRQQQQDRVLQQAAQGSGAGAALQSAQQQRQQQHEASAAATAAAGAQPGGGSLSSTPATSAPAGQHVPVSAPVALSASIPASAPLMVAAHGRGSRGTGASHQQQHHHHSHHHSATASGGSCSSQSLALMMPSAASSMPGSSCSPNLPFAFTPTAQSVASSLHHPYAQLLMMQGQSKASSYRAPGGIGPTSSSSIPGAAAAVIAAQQTAAADAASGAAGGAGSHPGSAGTSLVSTSVSGRDITQLAVIRRPSWRRESGTGCGAGAASAAGATGSSGHTPSYDFSAAWSALAAAQQQQQQLAAVGGQQAAAASTALGYDAGVLGDAGTGQPLLLPHLPFNFSPEPSPARGTAATAGTTLAAQQLLLLPPAPTLSPEQGDSAGLDAASAAAQPPALAAEESESDLLPFALDMDPPMLGLPSIGLPAVVPGSMHPAAAVAAAGAAAAGDQVPGVQPWAAQPPVAASAAAAAVVAASLPHGLLASEGDVAAGALLRMLQDAPVLGAMEVLSAPSQQQHQQQPAAAAPLLSRLEAAFNSRLDSGAAVRELQRVQERVGQLLHALGPQ